jgi:hypothetical protein
VVDLSRTDNPWERRKPTTDLTNKKPVAQRDPWERERGVIEDIKNVAPSALRTGGELIPAGPAETSGLIPSLVRWVIQNSPFMSDQERQQTLGDYDTSYHQVIDPMDPVKDFGLESVRKNVSDPLLGPAERPQAQTFPGKLVQRGLEIAPSVFLGPGSIGQKVLVTAGSDIGGVGGKALAEQAGLSPAWQNAADIGGTLLGGVTPMAYNHLVNPNPIPAARQQSVNYLRARNVPMSVGQMTGNQRLLKKEQMAGGPAAWEEQGPAFTRAAADEQGGFPPDTDTLTNPVMRTELDRMGAEFNRLEARSNPVPFDQALQNDLLHTVVNYQRDNPLVAPVVEDIMNDLASNAAQNGGVLTGTGFQSARSKIGQKIRETSDDGVRGALIEMQDHLDDVIGRNLPPDVQRAWRTVRAQYRNFLPIEFAKSGQGATKRLGAIDPQSLMTAIRSVEGRRQVASGDRPMTQLAEAGGGVLTRPQTSGTPEGLREILAGTATLGGGGLALSGANMLAHMLPENIQTPMQILATVLGGAAGFAVPKLRDAFTRSGFGQAVAGRNLAPRVGTDRSALSALMALAGQAAERDYGDTGRR